MSNNPKYTDSIINPTEKDKTGVGFSFTSTPSLTNSLKRLSISNYFGSSNKKKEINSEESLISKNKQGNNLIEDIITVRSSTSSPIARDRQFNNSNNIQRNLRNSLTQSPSPSPLPSHLREKSNSNLPPTPNSEKQNSKISSTPTRVTLRENPTRQSRQMSSPIMKTEIENSQYETPSHDLDEDTKQTLSMLLSLGDDDDDDDDDDEVQGQGQEQILDKDSIKIDNEANTVNEQNVKSLSDKSNRNLLKELENEEGDIDVINIIDINKEDQSSIQNASEDEDEEDHSDDDDDDDMVDAKSRHSDYDTRKSIKSKQSSGQLKERNDIYRNGKAINKKVSQDFSQYNDNAEDNINDDDSDIVYHVDDLNIDDEVEAANKINEIKNLLSNRHTEYNSILDDITRFEEDNNQILNNLLQIDRDLDTFKISLNEVLQDIPSNVNSLESRSNQQVYRSQQQNTSITNYYDLDDISDISEIEVDFKYLINNKLKKLNNSIPSKNSESINIDQTVMSNLSKFIESTFHLLNNKDNLNDTNNNKNENSKLMKLNNELKIKSNVLIQSVSDLTYSLT